MRDLREFPRTTLRIVRPQRQRHHRYVVDAFWLDDRLADTDSLRHPVLVGEDLVVQPHQRRLAFHADLVFHGQHGHAGTADRIGVLYLVHLRALLPPRNTTQLVALAPTPP